MFDRALEKGSVLHDSPKCKSNTDHLSSILVPPGRRCSHDNFPASLRLYSIFQLPTGSRVCLLQAAKCGAVLSANLKFILFFDHPRGDGWDQLWFKERTCIQIKSIGVTQLSWAKSVSRGWQGASRRNTKMAEGWERGWRNRETELLLLAGLVV